MTRAAATRIALADLGLALLLAALLSAAWTWRGWADLSALHLPDTDDVMRLQQIRDWLAGQPFTDLTQHRLGDGVPMHWSRFADLVPAAIIKGLTPWLRAYRATLVAVIAWPAMLQATGLVLIGSIARRIDPHGAPHTAMLVAALAYPATTIFVPGRIDHHGLQVVLLLATLRAAVAHPGRASGALAGLFAAMGLVIGLETAPVLAVIALCLWGRWCVRADDHGTLAGFGLSLGMALAFGALVFGGMGWRYPACDGFTRTAWSVAEGAAISATVLGLVGESLSRPTARLGATVAAGLGACWLLWPSVAACLHPYAGVDPALARLWLNNVGEAQSLFAADPAVGIGYAGLMVAGILASGWRWLRTGSMGWAMLLAAQLMAFAITCVQLRGSYAGTMIAAPALAMMIAAARARGATWLAGAWLASAGICYPIAAQAAAGFVPSRAPAASHPSGSCATPQAMARLAALPAGTVFAPMDFGAYAIAATPHRLVAGPYHRNNAGNLAMYRLFLSAPPRAEHVAAQWQADYVVACPGAFAAAPAGSLADRLDHGAPPPWLARIFAEQDGPAIYRRVTAR